MTKPQVTVVQCGFARQLRANLTECKRLLWSRLRNRQLSGFKFRRQHPLPPYVLDFCCAELGLAVELDGGQHYDEAGQAKDQRRTGYLRQQGLEVLRLSNLDVLQNLDGVLAELLRLAETLTPHPNPSPRRGEGARVKPARAHVRFRPEGLAASTAASMPLETGPLSPMGRGLG